MILLDPEHPAIENDDDLNWIYEDNQEGRVFRGLTSSGRKTHGVHGRRKGAEYVRPGRRQRNSE